MDTDTLHTAHLPKSVTTDARYRLILLHTWKRKTELQKIVRCYTAISAKPDSACFSCCMVFESVITLLFRKPRARRATATLRNPL